MEPDDEQPPMHAAEGDDLRALRGRLRIDEVVGALARQVEIDGCDEPPGLDVVPSGDSRALRRAIITRLGLPEDAASVA